MPASSRIPYRAGMELLGDTYLYVVEMAACSRAFSQENFMIGDLHFVVSVRESPEKGENEIVIVSRRGK